MDLTIVLTEKKLGWGPTVNIPLNNSSLDITISNNSGLDAEHSKIRARVEGSRQVGKVLAAKRCRD